LIKAIMGRSSTFRLGVALLALCFVGLIGLLAAYVFGERAITADTSPTADISPINSEVAFLGYSDALDKQSFKGTNLGGLSGLTYDPTRDIYYSLVDKAEDTTPARFYTLRLPIDQSGLGDPEISDVTTLSNLEGQPFTRANFDGEGIAVTQEGELLVGSEVEPSIRRFSLDGRFLADFPVPQKFLVAPRGTAQPNGAFESLALSPDGNSLFTATQEPLSSDGQDSQERKRIRLLRYEDRGSAGFESSEEFFYLTEPRRGATDIAALSESELLTLESGKVFRVSLDGAEDISDEESLTAPGLAPLEKELLVDLAKCPLPSSAEGSLGNLEGLSLGPELTGGRRALLLQGDDGFSSSHKTHVLALGLQLQHSAPPEETGACE
jgi:hypothetical protein